jgi:DNA repair protein RadA/Sms
MIATRNAISRRKRRGALRKIGFHVGIVLFCCFGVLAVARGFLPSSSIVRRPIAKVIDTGPPRSPIERMALRDDDGDDDDDDDEPPDVDVSKFSPPKSSVSYGPGRGRSAPSQRKAMGTSGSSSTSVHVCTNCGAEFVKWMGRCPTCREWNTLQEFKVDRGESNAKGRPSFGGGATSFSAKPSSWLDGTRASDFENQPVRVTDVYREVQKVGGGFDVYADKMRRIQVPNDDEINTVLGGGIMSGSLTLIGGDPGVGKSTLMLQMAGAIAGMSAPSRGVGMGAEPADSKRTLGPVWYISGEENPDQIASRASRLGIFESELWLLSETHVDTLAEQVVASYHQSEKTTKDGEVIPGQEAKPPALLIIDSIQTMVCESGGHSAAGGVTQVRECVALFLRLSKSTGIPIFLVGHVTKSGDVAGPRTVEHMVDCVLYLEGGDMSTIGGVNLRMLRAAKNRFGSSDEVGVYEMTTGRLRPVSDPSSLFLSNRIDAEDSEGCAIAIALEGLRAVTVEVQALVTPVAGSGGYGRRTVDGIENARLLLLLGVLQKRIGMYFSKQDVYINVVGRMRLDRNAQEGHASDLAVAVSVVSSFMSIPVRGDTAFVGEVGLLGELRPVPAIEKRIQEARRMGFSRVVTPRTTKSRQKVGPSKPGFSRFMGIDWIQCDTLSDAINEGLVTRLPKGRRKTREKQDAEEGDKPEFSSGRRPPGALGDLMLDQIITDDEDDENDDDDDWS